MSNEDSGVLSVVLNVKKKRCAGIEPCYLGGPQVATVGMLFRDAYSNNTFGPRDSQIVGRTVADVPQDGRLPQQVAQIILCDRKKGALRLDHKPRTRFVEEPNGERYNRGHDCGQRNKWQQELQGLGVDSHASEPTSDVPVSRFFPEAVSS